jgi:16S rRNA processing protein RimM
MGRVTAPHGVKGWVKVAPFTARPDALGLYGKWWVGRSGDWREVEVAESAVHGASLLARLAGCTDRDAAASLRGCEVAVPRGALAETAADEYYWADLVGLDVVDGQGRSLGMVSALFSNGAHDVMRVGAGKAERLVPFVAAVVKHVDLAGRRIVVDWGLDW